MTRKSPLTWNACLLLLLTLAGAPLGALAQDKDPGFLLTLPFKEGQEFSITNGYGNHLHRNSDHYSLDFNLPKGTPVYAAAPGRVTHVVQHNGCTECYGTYVMVEHLNGYSTLYAHLQSTSVIVNDWVNPGISIGLSGFSGTDSEHLHFTLYRNSSGPSTGTATRPEPFQGCTKNGNATCTGLSLWNRLRRDRDAPAVVRNTQTLNAELFVRGRNDALWHCTWASGTCTWTYVGGVLTSGPTAAWDVASGTPTAFVRGLDNQVWNVSRVNGAWQFTQIGTRRANDRPTGTYNAVEGRLEVFIRALNSHLLRSYKTGPTTWSTWEDLGGVLASEPEVLQDASGRPRAFAQAASNYLLYSIRAESNGSWVPETYFPMHTTQLVGTSSAASLASGRVDVFSRGADHALWHTAAVPDAWPSSATRYGGVLSGQPAVARNSDKSLSVLLRGVTNEIWHFSSATTQFTSLGSGPFTSDPAVSRVHDGRLVAFAWRGDALYFTQQQAPSSPSWTAWAPLNLPSGF
jgi:hypothetical protein